MYNIQYKKHLKNVCVCLFHVLYFYLVNVQRIQSARITTSATTPPRMEAIESRLPAATASPKLP